MQKNNSFLGETKAMDQTTHDIRHANWQEIVKQCLQRPVGITIKQWCRVNDLSEKSYYYW